MIEPNAEASKGAGDDGIVDLSYREAMTMPERHCLDVTSHAASCTSSATRRASRVSLLRNGRRLEPNPRMLAGHVPQVQSPSCPLAIIAWSRRPQAVRISSGIYMARLVQLPSTKCGSDSSTDLPNSYAPAFAISGALLVKVSTDIEFRVSPAFTMFF